MKALIILAALLSTTAFADEKPFMEFGDIKGDVEASVIDNAEESADVIESETATKAKELDKSSTKAQDYNSSRPNRSGRKHTRLDTDDDGDGIDVDDVARVCNAKDDDCDDQDRDAATGLPTGKRQHKPVK